MAADFVFLTDTHHYPDAPEDFGAPKMLTRSREVLDAIVPAVNELGPDFIVHGGDLLCGGGSFDLPRETYLRSVDEVSAAFSGFYRRRNFHLGDLVTSAAAELPPISTSTWWFRPH